MKPYTPEEDQTIYRMALDGSTDAEIAAKVGRSLYGIRHRRARLRVQKARHFFQAHEDKAILRGRADGLPIRRIAHQLNRDPSSVSNRLRILEGGGDSRPVPTRPYLRKRRICLGCESPFVSEWEGNRMCNRCRGRTSDYAPNLEGVSL